MAFIRLGLYLILFSDQLTRPQMSDLQYQYDLVKSSREVLFDYCRTLTPEHLVMEHTNFGRGSIRNLLVHIANVYQFWIGAKALQRDQVFTSFDAIGDMDGMISLYREIDELMNEFISTSGITPMKQLSFERNGVRTSDTVMKLFTHVITHEYHHKGQILSMSRHMGYIPVDTDVIR